MISDIVALLAGILAMVFFISDAIKLKSFLNAYIAGILTAAIALDIFRIINLLKLK